MMMGVGGCVVMLVFSRMGLIEQGWGVCPGPFSALDGGVEISGVCGTRGNAGETGGLSGVTP